MVAKRKRGRTPGRLPPEKWLAVGITILRGPHGEEIPSHISFGDVHAEKIISGAISFEQALRAEANRQRVLRDRWLYRARSEHGLASAADILRDRGRREW